MHDAIFDSIAADLVEGAPVAVLTGAGVSAESGVPTFRGGVGAPVWRDFWDPAVLSSRELLYKDPKLVWEWFEYRRAIVAGCAPNDAHRLLARLQKAYRRGGLTIVTQNVDGLHQKAGAEVIELHGNMWVGKGLRCTHMEDLSRVPLGELPPSCSVCGGPLRPWIVLFGEQLRMKDWKPAEAAARTCRLMLVIGTSAQVAPASELPRYAKTSGARVVVVNPDSAADSTFVDTFLPLTATAFARGLEQALGRAGWNETSETTDNGRGKW